MRSSGSVDLSGSDDADLEPGDPGHEHIDQIGHKARRGFTWSLGGNLVTKAGSFVVGLVIARLLIPDEFGVFAVALAAMTFAVHINDAGIVAACIQWRGKLEEVAPTAATIALLSSLSVYGLIWVAAPSFATLSGVPQAAPVVRLLCVAIIIDGIAAVRAAALHRRFEQDRQAKANVIGMLAYASVALPLAFAGAGAYALAIATLAQWAVTDTIVFKMGNLPIKLGFDRRVAKRLLKFGLPLATSFGMEAVLMNADFVIVGNVLGAAALGYYLLAYNISSWVPGMVGTAVRFVAIPGYSRLAEQGPEALELGVRRSLPLLLSAILPAAVVMATLAPQMIEGLYGDKWGPSAVALSYLTVLMVVRMLTALAVDIVTSSGFTHAVIWLSAGWAAALVPALWIGTRLDGIRGTAIAHGVVGLLVALPLAVFALRLAGVSLVPTLPALIRPIAAAVISAAVTVLIDKWVDGPAFVQLLVAGGAGMIVYFLVVVPRDQFRQLKTRLSRTPLKPEDV
jgi:O-antigen/teichoic acid export membrane protein